MVKGMKGVKAMFHNENERVHLHGESLSFNQLNVIFEVLKANAVRNRIASSVIFLKVCSIKGEEHEESTIEFNEQVDQFLQRKVRQSDLVFGLMDKLSWCVVLTNSGENEAKAFLDRLFVESFSLNIEFVAAVAEVRNRQAGFEDLLRKGMEYLERADQERAWHIEYITDYKEKDREVIRVSLLENNEILRSVLCELIQNLSIDSFDIQIQTFKDGYYFLDSDWYHSSHTHFVILNDILPRKNGMDVLHFLRKLPNSHKFVIFMMTKSKSEESMIYALENGVDHYLVKPFNLRLFEAQLRRGLNSLWN